MAVGSIWIAGCGSGGEVDRPAVGTHEQVRCLSCGTDPSGDEPGTPQAKPRMAASPEELFFYPDGPESPELEPKPITVVNRTGRIAAITHALIGEDEDLAGGTPYFKLVPLEEAIWLEADEAGEVRVAYLGSAKQQAALLVIYTSAPETPTLVIPLTGKYFFDN